MPIEMPRERGTIRKAVPQQEMTLYASKPMPYFSNVLLASRQSIRENPPKGDNAIRNTSNIASGVNDPWRKVLASALMRIAFIVLSLYLYKNASAGSSVADHVVRDYSVR